jgi:hypothetical protein
MEEDICCIFTGLLVAIWQFHSSFYGKVAKETDQDFYRIVDFYFYSLGSGKVFLRGSKKVA